MPDHVTLKELALEFGIDKSNVRKYALKSGFDPVKVRTASSGGQLTLALTSTDADALRELREKQGFTNDGSVIGSVSGLGFFYVIQLVPELEPGRVKLGFTNDLEARLQTYKTVAPTLHLLHSQHCKRAWERTAIDSVTRGCKALSTEVFICGDINVLLEQIEAFFVTMPTLSYDTN